MSGMKRDLLAAAAEAAVIATPGSIRTSRTGKIHFEGPVGGDSATLCGRGADYIMATAEAADCQSCAKALAKARRTAEINGEAAAGLAHIAYQRRLAEGVPSEAARTEAMHRARGEAFTPWTPDVEIEASAAATGCGDHGCPAEFHYSGCPVIIAAFDGRTADGHKITDGMAVWDYDRRPGYVYLGNLGADGWFHVVATPGEKRGSLMNAPRVAVRDPHTGVLASDALAITGGTVTVTGARVHKSHVPCGTVRDGDTVTGVDTDAPSDCVGCWGEPLEAIAGDGTMITVGSRVLVDHANEDGGRDVGTVESLGDYVDGEWVRTVGVRYDRDHMVYGHSAMGLSTYAVEMSVSESARTGQLSYEDITGSACLNHPAGAADLECHLSREPGRSCVECGRDLHEINVSGVRCPSGRHLASSTVTLSEITPLMAPREAVATAHAYVATVAAERLARLEGWNRRNKRSRYNGRRR